MTQRANGEAFIIIDVQNDFCTGGALEVPGGESVVPVINALQERYDMVVATQDWHPPHHHSFAVNHVGKEQFSTTQMHYGEQVLWPEHCVQGTEGAAFHKDLATERLELILRKGHRAEIDSYSAFFENDRRTATGLAGYLMERGVRSVALAGLATDFCVCYSALDAIHLGFSVTLYEDASRGIDLVGSLAAARQRMLEAGVTITQSGLG